MGIRGNLDKKVMAERIVLCFGVVISFNLRHMHWHSTHTASKCEITLLNTTGSTAREKYTLWQSSRHQALLGAAMTLAFKQTIFLDELREMSYVAVLMLCHNCRLDVMVNGSELAEGEIIGGRP